MYCLFPIYHLVWSTHARVLFCHLKLGSVSFVHSWLCLSFERKNRDHLFLECNFSALAKVGLTSWGLNVPSMTSFNIPLRKSTVTWMEQECMSVFTRIDHYQLFLKYLTAYRRLYSCRPASWVGFHIINEPVIRGHVCVLVDGVLAINRDSREGM